VLEREQFVRDPASLVRIFRIAQQEGLEIYSYTKDLIIESLAGFDRRVRRDAAAVGDFLALLDDPRSNGSGLDEMHELGVLRRLIPEFARITARWQHSLYHVYTVDVHSIFVVKTLKRLRAGELVKEQPELTRLIADLPRPAVLYMAAFLHDVGKGWNRGDHSTRGAAIAEVVGKRFEEANLPTWTHEETEDLAWLVKEHLLMSKISQRRDLSDRDLIESFAKNVGDAERLLMLYLLTYADMRSTSPKMWTDWKGVLLAELYDKSRTLLSDPTPADGLVSPSPRAHIEARRARLCQEMREAAVAHRRPEPNEALVDEFARAVPDRYLLAVRPTEMLDHVEPWREVREGQPLALQIRHQRHKASGEEALRPEDTTELTIVCRDRPGLLALLAGTLAANRFKILTAQIFSIGLSANGAGKAALDILQVQDSDGGISYDSERWDRLRADLEQALETGGVEEMVERRVRGSRLRRPKPKIETRVVVARDASRTETVIDVFCQDHLGALYNISKALADQGLTIRLAKISTVDDYVADGFYVADAKTGAKVEDEARQKTIIEAVRKAIDDALAS
jgi:[protein-PII] uridylyltransferase